MSMAGGGAACPGGPCKSWVPGEVAVCGDYSPSPGAARAVDTFTLGTYFTPLYVTGDPTELVFL